MVLFLHITYEAAVHNSRVIDVKYTLEYNNNLSTHPIIYNIRSHFTQAAALRFFHPSARAHNHGQGDGGEEEGLAEEHEDEEEGRKRAGAGAGGRWRAGAGGAPPSPEPVARRHPRAQRRAVF